MRSAAAFLILTLAAGLAAISVRAEEEKVLDDFHELTGWTVETSPTVQVVLRSERGAVGKGLRLAFDFAKGSGYVILRKRFDLRLPDNYAFTFRVRGEGKIRSFEFKLLDPGFRNVWWQRREKHTLPSQWRRYRVRKAALEFAWGPSGGAPLTEIGAVEFAVTAPAGSRGSLFLDDLRFVRREAVLDSPQPPRVTARSFHAENRPERALDGDSSTFWASSGARRQWLQLDFGVRREYGGIVLEWDPDCYATDYAVEISPEGTRWKEIGRLRSGNGQRDYLPLPDQESRFLRLVFSRSSRCKGYRLREIFLEPPSFASSPNRFFETIARLEPLGHYPRAFRGEQVYWTLVGGDRGRPKGLLSEDGILEVDRGGFTLEPFLFAGGRLLSWAEGKSTPSLNTCGGKILPVPSIERDYEELSLIVTGFVREIAGEPVLFARYRVQNRSAGTRLVKLFVALRPFQVNPPWQSLFFSGGVSPIHRLRSMGREIQVEGKRVMALTRPAAFGATRFIAGEVVDFLRQGRLPAAQQIGDLNGWASGAWEFRLQVPAHGEREVYVAVAEGNVPMSSLTGGGPRLLMEACTAWEKRLSGPELSAPGIGAELIESVRSNLGYILMNREGPALNPGPRTYARSWIRDGALMSSALLSLGHTQEVRRFLRWYAEHQRSDGGIPCCIDRHGPDATPEHDSHGEFIYTLAEYYRHTHDLGLLRTLWPRIVKTMRFIESLRQGQRTEVYQTSKRAFFGLMPESISHEGYASRPVHAFWDDFWTLRGIKDAAMLAVALGHTELAKVYATMAEEFRRDVVAAIEGTMLRHGLDYLPASVELADIDPNAIAIAVTIAGEAASLPRAALQKTFDDFLAHFRRRLRGQAGDGYTPYEIRIVEALVRLGRRRDAWELLQALLAGQRPLAWRQWAEVVWRDPRAPRFIGDMPHSWIGAEFIRSVRSLFAFEDEEEQSLVLAAGIPEDWLRFGESAIRVRGLPTWFGRLDYTLQSEDQAVLRLRLGGDLLVPKGGIRIRPPGDRPIRWARVNGRPGTEFTEREVKVFSVPVEVEIGY